MNCKKIQEYIITDYIDGRMGAKPKSLVEQHLLHCQACKEYLISIETQVVNPFVNASTAVPDQLLWARIKETIQEEDKQLIEAALKPNFWERVRSSVHIPRPAIAFATVVTMIFMIGSSGQLFFSSPVMNINGQDQMEYVSSLIDEPIDLSSSNGNDPQTAIEKVFL